MYPKMHHPFSSPQKNVSDMRFFCYIRDKLYSAELIVGRGDKSENFDLMFFPTSKTLKGLLTIN